MNKNESRTGGGRTSSLLSLPAARQPKSANLHRSRSVKNDEFYTRIETIEDELKHYTEHFKGRVVFCIVMIRNRAISGGILN